ncbi:class I SAM-dependent methyltransferase [Photobacterium alginatilyticum]|uniref:class I SAM-dependent methyltransferase n=1 Tax=Photobacterium alginatilyticum TaxID=1775171 RepID=UPI004068FB32
MNNNNAVAAGQAVYTKKVLSIYDLWVLGFSNTYLWKCSTNIISQKFLELASSNHLDVGVGTGYYLKNYLSNVERRVALVDLNQNSLKSTASAIQHFNPEVYRRNVLEPLQLNCEKFDSISMNYLLHCLPGDFSGKGVVFSNLKELLNEGGVLFGSTILGKGVQKNFFANKLMNFYNKKGIFSNHNDDIISLEKVLKENFSNVQIDIVGCVVLFSGTKI